jgi:hypothetical protein
VRAPNFLGEREYQVLPSKPKFQNKLRYLGCVLTAGESTMLSNEKKKKKKARPPCTRKQLRAFLGMAESYSIWTLDFGLLAKP